VRLSKSAAASTPIQTQQQTAGACINSFLKATKEDEQGDPASADLKVVAEIQYPGGKKGVPAARHVLESRC
jgi:hypothetical protein